MASGMPGRPPPLPMSASRFAARQLRQHRQRIQQVVADHLLLVAHRGEVVHLVPLAQQRGEGEQLFLRGGGKSRPSAARPRVSSCSRWRSCALAAFAHRGAAPLEVHQQQRDGRRRDALDARGLAEGFRPVLVELLLHFDREAAHRAVVEVVRQRRVFLLAALGDLLGLAVDVALVLGLDLELLDGLRVGRSARPRRAGSSGWRSSRRAGAAARPGCIRARAACRARVRRSRHRRSSDSPRSSSGAPARARWRRACG
jgi:hypothetical protein